MSRHSSVRLLAASAFAASLLLGVAAVSAGGPGVDPAAKSGQPQAAQNAFPQPDTNSPDWKPLSDDLGIWIGESDRTGVRGRLYVRRGNSWMPVAVDGAADIHGLFPAGK
jgi:hypothetical protein